MHRLARTLFTLCSAVSLLLFVASLVLWVRSYGRQDILRVARSGAVIGQPPPDSAVAPFASRVLMSKPGRLEAAAFHVNVPDATATPGGTPAAVAWEPWGPDFYITPVAPAVPGRPRTETWWFNASAVEVGENAYAYVTIPYWSLLASSGLLPALWLRRRRREWRSAARALAGSCTSCGYDLRATPGRCPECGAAGTAATSSPAAAPA
jgi:hypothetical protein